MNLVQILIVLVKYVSYFSTHFTSDRGGTMHSRSVKVSPTLSSIKHVETAGNDYAVIMALHEAPPCPGSVVFKQNRFKSVWFLVNIGK